MLDILLSNLIQIYKLIKYLINNCQTRLIVIVYQKFFPLIEMQINILPYKESLSRLDKSNIKVHMNKVCAPIRTLFMIKVQLLLTTKKQKVHKHMSFYFSLIHGRIQIVYSCLALCRTIIFQQRCHKFIQNLSHTKLVNGF